MTKARTTKKAAGRRLNKEGRLSPVDAMQVQLEHWHKMMVDEIAKPPEESDAALVATYAARAHKCAEALAPYRCARISPTDEDGTRTTTKVIRVVHTSPTIEVWQAQYCVKNEVEQAISDAENSDKADEIIQRAKGGVPVEVPDLPAGKLN